MNSAPCRVHVRSAGAIVDAGILGMGLSQIPNNSEPRSTRIGGGPLLGAAGAEAYHGAEAVRRMLPARW